MVNSAATSEEDRRWLLDDLAYHQSRVLLLIEAVAADPGHARKLDGLTKLAKLDFLVRYPGLAPAVLEDLQPTDPRLHIEDPEFPTRVDDPMIRYKYGPWDDRYYPVIGALVSRGLVKYVRGRRGSVALAPTPSGQALASDLKDAAMWGEIAERCAVIAQATGGMSGNHLKSLIYANLPALMNRPQRTEIR